MTRIDGTRELALLRWRTFFLGFAMTAGAVLAACGGGDDDGGFGAGGFGETPGQGAENRDQGGDQNGGDADTQPSGGESGPAPDVSAEPGEARLEVDGEVIRYGGAYILYYTCDTTDGAQINIQSPEGQDMLLQYRGGFGSITARDRSADVYYAASIQDGQGLWVEGNTVIYSGQMERQQGSDRLDSETVDGTLVVNCDPIGGEHPRAEIDGTVYEIPAAGTQAYECEAGDQVSVNIQPQLSGPQLQLQVRKEGERWLGSVTLNLDDVAYFSQIPGDGEGLEIDGKRITYSGLFEHRNRQDRTVIAEDLEGTVSVTCP